MARANRKPSKKGTGFEHPLKPREHWLTAVTYINMSLTIYYLSRTTHFTAEVDFPIHGEL